MTTAKHKPTLADKIRAFFGKVNPSKSPAGFSACCALLDAIRKLKTFNNDQSLIPVANFIAGVADLPWQYAGVSFESESDSLAQSSVDVAQEAIALFAEVLETDGVLVDELTPELLHAIAQELSANADLAPPSVVEQPEIYSHPLMRRVFNPAKFSVALASRLGFSLAYCKSSLGDDRLSLVVPGAAPDEFIAMTETGECLCVSASAISSKLIDEDTYTNVPVVLLVLAVLGAPELADSGLITAENAAAIAAGILGNFTAPVHKVDAQLAALQPLLKVIDMSAAHGTLSGPTGPVGASVRFPVSALPETFVVLDMQVDAAGAYVVSKLVRTSANAQHDRVLMRRDLPRYDTVRGFYFFPRQNALIVLKV